VSHWRANPGQATWLRAALAFVPLGCLLAVVVLVSIATVRGCGDPTGHGLVADGALKALLLGVAASWLGVPLYLHHLDANERLHRARRSRWRFALRLYALLAMPRYWWTYMRGSVGRGHNLDESH